MPPNLYSSLRTAAVAALLVRTMLVIPAQADQTFTDNGLDLSRGYVWPQATGTGGY